jgi:DivIVA domain-containing protein
MGSQDIVGLVLIGLGFSIIGLSLPPLIKAVRRKERLAAIPVGVWSGLLTGAGVLLNGIYVRGARDPNAGWAVLNPGTLIIAGLLLPVVPWIVSRRKAGRLDSSSAGTPGLGSEPAIALDAGTTGLIERIKTVTFSTTRLSPGYDEEEVDVFLDKLVAALSRDGQIDRSELRDVRFSRTRMRPGYVSTDVDAFLEEVAQATW